MTSSGPWKSEKAQAHWNRVVVQMGDDFFDAPSTQYYRRREIALFQRFFGELKGKRLLKLDLWNEVMNTRILAWAAAQGAKISALDIADHIVRLAKEVFSREGYEFEFVVSDIRDIGFPDNHFDLLYTMGTMEHVPEHDQVAREIYRVLKPGGIAIVGVPNKFDPFLRPALVYVLDKLGKYAYSPERAFSARELREVLEQAGLEVVERTGILFMPGILRMADLFLYKRCPPLARLTGWMCAPFEWLESRFPALQRHGYLIAYGVRKSSGERSPRR